MARRHGGAIASTILGVVLLGGCTTGDHAAAFEADALRRAAPAGPVAVGVLATHPLADVAWDHRGLEGLESRRDGQLGWPPQPGIDRATVVETWTWGSTGVSNGRVRDTTRTRVRERTVTTVR